MEMSEQNNEPQVSNVNEGESQMAKSKLPLDDKSKKAIMYGLIALFAVIIISAGVYLIIMAVNKPQTGGQPAAQETKSASVQITNDGFMPATISVSKGTTVVWDNTDTAPHWVATDPYPKNDGLAGFDSAGNLNKGDSYSFTFDTAGTFTYHDQLNPYKIQGSVVVK